MEEISRLKAELESAFASGNKDQAFSALKEIHDKRIGLKLNWTPGLVMARTMVPTALLRSPEFEDSPSIIPAEQSIKSNPSN